eukprot:5302809-Pyramimonas_sp.AAC.2
MTSLYGSSCANNGKGSLNSLGSFKHFLFKRFKSDLTAGSYSQLPNGREVEESGELDTGLLTPGGCGGGGTQEGKGGSKAPPKWEPPVFVAPPPPVFEKPPENSFINSDRCNHCKRKHDAWETPLVLCDVCPRAFHLG